MRGCVWGRRLVVIIAVLGLLISLLPTWGGQPSPDRVAGDSRTATAAAIATRAFSDGGETVYVADAALA